MAEKDKQTLQNYPFESMQQKNIRNCKKKYTQLRENAKNGMNSLFIGSYEKLTTSDKADIYATGCVN